MCARLSWIRPFGKPSDKYIVGTLNGVEVAFLSRHGQGHVVNPSEVNYRANIMGMKMLGVEWIISVAACGSLQEEIVPGHIVISTSLLTVLCKDLQLSLKRVSLHTYLLRDLCAMFYVDT